MKILILGALGFIGKNLVSKLLENSTDELILLDCKEWNEKEFPLDTKRCRMICESFDDKTDFDAVTKNVDIVYHLISTTLPNTSMEKVPSGITENVVTTACLLGACVKNHVKKVVFLSSGGTVYGLNKEFPLKEDAETNPISAYGLQKIAVEKLLYLYHYTYGLDYRVVRLANPYGRYQCPNGIQGVITTFLYHAMSDREICVYGDGEVIRDYVYIDDAINAIVNIARYEGRYKIFNVGSGVGRSINEIIQIIQKICDKKLNVIYQDKRKADVPVNILDTSRYEQCIGKISNVSIEEGIQRTLEYLKNVKDSYEM